MTRQLTLVLMGGGVDSIQLFKEIFSQPKLDIFMGVLEYGQGDTKSVDININICNSFHR